MSCVIVGFGVRKLREVDTVRCVVLRATGLKLCQYRAALSPKAHRLSSSLSSVRVVLFAAGGATNTQLTPSTAELCRKQIWLPGSWSCARGRACVLFLFCFFSLSEPSMFWLSVCQNKALSGFTLRVYCERTQSIVRSEPARCRPMCLCWVKKWKLLLRELAAWQARIGREVSDFPPTLSLPLCQGLVDPNLGCGGSLTLHYNSMATLGGSCWGNLNFTHILITLWPIMWFRVVQ